jgi:predicted transglutaminase-like protease
MSLFQIENFVYYRDTWDDNERNEFVFISCGSIRSNYIYNAFYGKISSAIFRLLRKAHRVNGPNVLSVIVQMLRQLGSKYLADSYQNSFTSNYFTYHNHHLDYLDVVQIYFTISRKFKIWMLSLHWSRLLWLSVFMGTIFYVVLLWKEVEILYKERKYRGPILIINFRMGLAVFYIVSTILFPYGCFFLP